MIADEVQTWNSTGHPSVFHHLYKTIKPDTIIAAKSNTAGVTPLSMVLAKKLLTEIIYFNKRFIFILEPLLEDF